MSGRATLEMHRDCDYTTLISVNGEIIADTLRLVMTSGPDINAGRARAQKNLDNARRLAACWNACIDMPVGHIEALDQIGTIGDLRAADAQQLAAARALLADVLSTSQRMSTSPELIGRIRAFLNPAPAAPNMFDDLDDDSAAVEKSIARNQAKQAKGGA